MGKRELDISDLFRAIENLLGGPSNGNHAALSQPTDRRPLDVSGEGMQLTDEVFNFRLEFEENTGVGIVDEGDKPTGNVNEELCVRSFGPWRWFSEKAGS